MHNPSGTPRTINKAASGVDLVQSYLDALLRDVSVDLQNEDVLAESAPGLPIAAEFLDSQLSPIVSAVTLIEEFAPSPAVYTASELSATATTEIPESAQHREQTNQTPLQLDAKTERVTPDWARHGFAGLLFEVAGLKMAAPLHALGGISLIDDKLQPVVGQADWFMGLLRWNGRNLRVIDTARFVMPERLENNAHRSAYQSVIVLGDSHWALAVDCADESVNLKADEIRWKHLTGTRPWLAGTLLQRLCALLDVDNLLSMLQQTELHKQESTGAEHIN
ncbi:MAG: chemotaxis protein CheW [Pseudohongiella sp.]|nr:chemotaxis protein CheW [Pseudohongiella sp.]